MKQMKNKTNDGTRALLEEAFRCLHEIERQLTLINDNIEKSKQ